MPTTVLSISVNVWDLDSIYLNGGKGGRLNEGSTVVSAILQDQRHIFSSRSGDTLSQS